MTFIFVRQSDTLFLQSLYISRNTLICRLFINRYIRMEYIDNCNGYLLSDPDPLPIYAKIHTPSNATQTMTHVYTSSSSPVPRLLSRKGTRGCPLTLINPKALCIPRNRPFSTST